MRFVRRLRFKPGTSRELLVLLRQTIAYQYNQIGLLRLCAGSAFQPDVGWSSLTLRAGPCRLARSHGGRPSAPGWSDWRLALIAQVSFVIVNGPGHRLTPPLSRTDRMK